MVAENPLRRKIVSIVVITILVLFVLFILDRLFSVRYSDEVSMRSERGKNYEEVAARFVTKNAFMARKLGKVESLYHYGKGGSAGGFSYNVFNLHGTDKSGICYVTLAKDEEEMWYVSSAQLSVDGKMLEVPVKRSVGQKWKLFRLKE